MAKNQMQSMMQGAFVLTAASFVAKLLSAVYRVPFQNLVGDEGFYVYQQIYPIYGLAMTLALSGLPQFISKYVAEQETPKAQQTAIRKLYPIVLGAGVLLFLLTFLGAAPLAYLMGDRQLAPLIRVVSFTFLFVPILSFYRGSFQGNLLMIPTAVSQVAEQLVRVAVILGGAVAFRQLGLTIYQAGTIAMFGAICGGGVAVLILLYYQNKINGRQLGLREIQLTQRWDKPLIRRFLLEGGLVSMYSGFLILFQLVDSFLVANALQAQGLLPQVARVTKGVYDRGQPLVQLGLVVAGALSSTFLPALTKYLLGKNRSRFLSTTKIYLRLTASISLAAAVGLALLMPFINFALFKDAQGNLPLVLFVFAVFLMGMIQAYQSIAQSQNHFRIPLKAAAWGVLIKVIATWPFTRFLGTAGASLATLLGLTVTLLYLIRREDEAINSFWRERHFSRKLLRSTGAMIMMILVYYLILVIILDPRTHRLSTLLMAIGGVSVGVTAFVRSAIRNQLFTVREWLLLPFGKKILTFKLRK